MNSLSVVYWHLCWWLLNLSSLHLASLLKTYNMEDILNLEDVAVTSDMSPFHREGWNWNLVLLWRVAKGQHRVTSLNYPLWLAVSHTHTSLHSLASRLCLREFLVYCTFHILFFYLYICVCACDHLCMDTCVQVCGCVWLRCLCKNDGWQWCWQQFG